VILVGKGNGYATRVRLDDGSDDISIDDRKDLFGSLSAVTEANGFLWAASDEGRTLECLKPDGNKGYSLKRQCQLDKIFGCLPGEREAKPPEADIESLSVSNNTWLWICGSHGNVRSGIAKTRQESVESKKTVARPEPDIMTRPSRCLLGRVKLIDGGGAIEENGDHLPFEGIGSLRALLMGNRHLQSFMGLPAKENGLDIEGITATESGAVFLGLRGPVVAGYAVVVEAKADTIFTKDVDLITYFIDFDGLGVRDLTHDGDDMLILAGPVGGLDGPFRIYHWKPGKAECVQSAKLLHQWPIKVRGTKAKSAGRGVVMQSEHPEAFCWFKRNRKPGLIALYDSPDKRSRIKKDRRYSADWIPHPKRA
jgi:hypothetical protein